MNMKKNILEILKTKHDIIKTYNSVSEAKKVSFKELPSEKDTNAKTKKEKVVKDKTTWPDYAHEVREEFEKYFKKNKSDREKQIYEHFFAPPSFKELNKVIKYYDILKDSKKHAQLVEMIVETFTRLYEISENKNVEKNVKEIEDSGIILTVAAKGSRNKLYISGLYEKSNISFYPKAPGEFRKLYSGDGTALGKKTIAALDNIKYDFNNGDDQQSAVAFELDKFSKPKISDETIVGTTHDGVKKFFEHEMFKNVADAHKKLYIPHKDGKPLFPPSKKNAVDYLELTVNSDTLNNLIKYLNTAKGIPNDFKSLLKKHHELMKSIITNARKKDNPIPITSPSVKKQVSESWSDLSLQLFLIEEKLCNAMLKNLAEILIYEVEICNGENVILPASGSFPTADKIVLGKDYDKNGPKSEALSGVSVKYGKSGTTYGIPGQLNKTCDYHSDPKFRKLFDNKLDANNLFGFNNAVFEDRNEFNYYYNKANDVIKDFFKNDIDYIYKTYSEYYKKNKDKILGLVARQKYNDIREEYRAAIKPIVKKYKVEKILGLKKQKNKEVFLKEYYSMVEKDSNIDNLIGYIGLSNFKVLFSDLAAFMSVIFMSSVMTSANGFEKEIMHAHVHIDKNNKKVDIETETGKPDLVYWNIMFRLFESRGGGMRVGFNGHKTKFD